MRRLLVVLLTALVFPASAAAHTTIVAPVASPYPYQQWVDESAMPTPEVTINIVEVAGTHGCPGRELTYAGCTQPSEQMIWLAPEMTVGQVRQTFLHELGHNADTDMTPEWMRTRFMEIMRQSGEWVIEGEPSSWWSPNERFADIYAQCSVAPYIRPGYHNGEGTVFSSDPMAGARRHNAICRMMGKL
jgi:hypothetical protein